MSEPGFELCASCRARLPPSTVFMSTDAAADFLSDCRECSHKLRVHLAERSVPDDDDDDE